MKILKIIWFDSLKGIGEGLDSKNKTVFINTYHQTLSVMFPKTGDLVKVGTKS